MKHAAIKVFTGSLQRRLGYYTENSIPKGIQIEITCHLGGKTGRKRIGDQIGAVPEVVVFTNELASKRLGCAASFLGLYKLPQRGGESMVV